MKINYELNCDSTIESWQCVPFYETKPFIEIEDAYEVIINVDKIIGGQFVQGDRGAYFQAKQTQEKETENKSRRSAYIDAYRKYQAAVNYGEFQRAPAADVFIGRLRNKDWAALDNIPGEIKYFAGECSLAASGLIPQN